MYNSSINSLQLKSVVLSITNFSIKLHNNSFAIIPIKHSCYFRLLGLLVSNFGKCIYAEKGGEK